MKFEAAKLETRMLPGLTDTYYLLKNPNRIKNNHPYTTLNKEEHFTFFGVLKHLVDNGLGVDVDRQMVDS